MKKRRLIALAMAAMMLLPFAASCADSSDGTDTGTSTQAPTGETGDENPGETSDATEAETMGSLPQNPDAVERTDFTSVYDKIGSKITIDMVKVDEDGIASVEYEGKTYELGMDFLSMAMVYNTAVPAGSEKYKTQEEVYNEWWKLYIVRWNSLVPEVPLYSNQYFDLYSAKIDNFVTTPYWGAADAIVKATCNTEDNSVILGSVTDLSGAFRNASWGKNSPGSSDLDIQNLVTGFSTVQTNESGSYIWNMQALAEEPTSKVNEDGTLTYTIKVRNDMKFSDGSAITAKNYIALVLANSTPVGVAAGGTGVSGQTLIGYDAFSKYDGTNDGKAVGEGEGAVTASKYFKGVQLLDDYTFAITLTSDYAGYYYAMANAGFSPDPLALYLGAKGDILVNENKECALNDAFYAKETKDGVEGYATAAEIKANLEWNSKLPYSGPYTVSNYDASTLTATLKLNAAYPGDDARGKATIGTVTYVKIVSETQMDQFKTGKVDVLAGITGGEDTKAALAVVNAEPTKYKETHYDRAGYGKLGFRCDYGPTSFVSVRRAIIYTIDRTEFAQTFTGGYGSVVHGPYYTGFSAYKAAEDELNELLETYEYSFTAAIAELEADGWTYNEKGETFDASKDAIRYKKLEGYEKSNENLNFKTVDSKYQTVKVGDDYYMPLAINWYGTQPNSVTDQLITAWQKNSNATTSIGMYITYTSSEFNPALYGELYRMPGYGYNGIPKLNAVNFATGFTSAAYDQSFSWSIDPEFYAAGYNGAFLMDEADFWSNYQ